jgi:hypothetical protein
MNLESAEKFVAEHTQKAQTTYARNCNRRTKDKHFKVNDCVVNDRVIVLIPDTMHSKLYSRWTGPATVVKVKSPYSYLVDTPYGSRKHYHANKLRPFVVRVQSLGIIQEADEDFDEVRETPQLTDSDLKPSQKLEPEILAHLTVEQKRQIIEMIDCYPECWSDKPGFCNLFSHEINLKPDFQPKQSYT